MRRRRRRTRTTRRRGRRRSETALRWPPRRFGLPQTSMVVRQPTLRCSVGVAMSCGGTNPPAQPARVSQLAFVWSRAGTRWSGDNIWPCVRVSKVPRDQTTFLSLSTFVGGIRT